jgi:DNA-binding SARP family transcriptional activator/tetratricopeptide (TPR) repeat protein
MLNRWSGLEWRARDTLGGGFAVAVSFCLLGDVEARVDGVAIDLGHAMRRCVLAALAVDVGRGVPVEQLAERVWGDRLPAHAGRTLTSYVSRLRQALRGAGIERRSGGYALVADPESVDLHAFRRLLGKARAADDDHALALVTSALDLWRGEPFAGLDTPWINLQRDVLNQERLTAELDRNDIELRLGRHHDVLPRAAKLAVTHPVDERCAGQLMLALYRCGRQADALECYEQVRRRLADQLGVDPSPALRQRHQQVLTADAALDVAAAAPVPRQLPPPPRLFVGRRAELATLSKALETHTTAVISAIGGAGGIGKTFLALHWAHQHIDRFPDGQLHVDLHGFDPSGTPTAPQAAIRGFLHALGVPTPAVPPDLDTQVGLYRSLVAGKRMLVLLDNAHDTAQVEPLLPGSAGCTVVVTSRNHLTGLYVLGAHLVNLDVLTPQEAHDLLAKRLDEYRVAAEPEAVADLLTHCAGMPLAISIVAARATTHPDFPLTVLADELRDASTRLDALDTGELTNLRAVFSWSYRALDPEAAAVFRLLGLAPGPDIGLAAAANLTALPTTRTRQLLRDLEAAHLVTQQAPDRYRMHDLTSLYAADRAGHDTAKPDRDAALRRLVDFYLHTAHNADHQLEPTRRPIALAPPGPGCHPLTPPDATVWFDTEHACLLAAQQTAAAQGWHDAVWQLAAALHVFQRRRGYGFHEHAVWQAALAAADHLGDRAAQALAHRHLGDACTLVGQHDAALDHLRQALVLAEETADQADTHQALSWAWERQGDQERALDHAMQALRLYHALGMTAREAEALNNVGWCAAQLGDYDQAHAHCEAALTLNRQDGHREGEAATLDSLGYIAHQTGHHGKAIDYYQQALALFRELGNTYEEANTLDNLGHPHLSLGQHDQARHAWRQALDLYRSQHRTTDADRIQRELASVP